MKTKKLLSLLLAVMMMLSVVPFYASAEAVALTEANVVEWPTVEYLNDDGMYYYEQPIEDGLALTGGVVTTDGTATGTVVEGKFEFNYEGRNLPTSSTASRAYIKFVPSDTEKYSGFTVDRSTNVTFVVTKTTPVLADAANDPVVATEVEAGATLSTSTLSGGKVVNPYNPDAPKLAARSWSWTNKTTVVNNSGYYEARLVCGSYNIIYTQVYVRIIGDTSVAVEFEEMPTVDAISYREGLTAGDLTITGGKASVAGSFKVKDATQALKAGSNSVTVVFVPEDTTINEVEMTLNVTVDKMPVYFVDEAGNEIIPEIRVPFGTYISTSRIKDLVSEFKTNYTEFTISGLSPNISTTVPGEYDAEIKISPKSNSYSNGINVKLIVEPIKITSVKYYGNSGTIYITLSYTNISGTFDVFVDGVLVGSALKLNKVNGLLECPYKAEVSGTHKLSLVYNKADSNDTCVVDSSEYDFTANAKRNISTEGLASNLKINGKSLVAVTHIYCGDEISLECVIADTFTGWEITDTQGNPVELEILTQVQHTDENGGVSFENVAGDLSCENIIFTMPDKDIIVKAKSTLDEDNPSEGDDSTGDTDGTTGGIDDIFGGLDIDNITQGDSDSAIVNAFNNIIAWIKNIIQTIVELFRSIGDHT